MAAVLESPAPAADAGAIAWLRRVRGSSRLALMLHLSTRVLTSLMALVWTRLLLRTMGKPLNGLFLSFQNAAQLGGVGDLGMGGAISIQVGQQMARGEEEELQKFLAVARTIFLGLALTMGCGFVTLMPWLAEPMGFKPVAGSGPLFPLFAVGSISVAGLVFLSYANNLNYGCGTVTWPIIPTAVILQFTLFSHWLLARHHCPLWMQYCPYAAGLIMNVLLAWIYLRASFVSLARILPMRFNFRMALTLFERSFWMYLCVLGNLVYVNTSSLVIQAKFGSAQVPLYRYNYRVCELAVFMILSASFVAVPKLTTWLADPSPEARARVLPNLRRMNQFQTLAGCMGALVYLSINDLFMTYWLGADMRAPLLWQAGFALNLAVTTSGDACIQAASRCGTNGIRVTGSVIGFTAIVNVVLSITAAKLGHMGGIALAAGVAQSILSLGLSLYVCRYLKTSWMPWVLRGWLLPTATVAAATALRMSIPLDTAAHALMLTGCFVALAAAVGLMLGINRTFIREELAMLRTFLPK